MTRYNCPHYRATTILFLRHAAKHGCLSNSAITALFAIMYDGVLTSNPLSQRSYSKVPLKEES